MRPVLQAGDADSHHARRHGRPADHREHLPVFEPDRAQHQPECECVHRRKRADPGDRNAAHMTGTMMNLVCSNTIARPMPVIAGVSTLPMSRNGATSAIATSGNTAGNHCSPKITGTAVAATLAIPQKTGKPIAACVRMV